MMGQGQFDPISEKKIFQKTLPELETNLQPKLTLRQYFNSTCCK